MAEDDIYGNKRKYENFRAHLDSKALPLGTTTHQGKQKYFCRNKANLRHFQALFTRFDSKDFSYIHRVRMLDIMMLIVDSTEKDLADCARDDIDLIMARMHSVYPSPESKTDFVKRIKTIWKTLFPENDEKGRPDERIMPYAGDIFPAKLTKAKRR